MIVTLREPGRPQQRIRNVKAISCRKRFDSQDVGFTDYVFALISDMDEVMIINENNIAYIDNEHNERL